MTESRLRAVVDTNVFVSGFLSENGPPALLVELLRDGAFVLVLSDQLTIELDDVFHRPRLARSFRVRPNEVEDFLLIARSGAIIGSPSGTTPVKSRDPKDDKLLQAAFSGGADYLVTGDRDLLVLREDPRLGRLKIVTVVEFVTRLDELKGTETPTE